MSQPMELLPRFRGENRLHRPRLFLNGVFIIRRADAFGDSLYVSKRYIAFGERLSETGYIDIEMLHATQTGHHAEVINRQRASG